MICSSYELLKRDPDIFFHPLSHKSEVNTELQELSRLIPLNQETPEFGVVVREYEGIRRKYTKDEFGFLVFKNTQEKTFLTAYTLMQVFVAAHQKGVFPAKPLASSSKSAAAASASSSIPSIKESEIGHPIAEEGLIVTIKKLDEVEDEYYVSFNPKASENQLSILSFSNCSHLGKGGFGITFKVLNVSKGVFEAIKIARDDTHTNSCAAHLKHEYTILNRLQNQLQLFSNNTDWPFQAAPHQLISFPTETQILSVAYLVKLYSPLNLKGLFGEKDLYSRVSFQQRVMLCQTLLRGFQILFQLGIHYCDISSHNILLLQKDGGFSPYIGDFGGVELLSQFQESLRNRFSKARSPEDSPRMHHILVSYRPDNMSLNDYVQLSQIRDKMKTMVAADPTLEKIEERVAQFQNKFFPELLAIKARQNIFAIGKLLYEILTGGQCPYPLDKKNGFPLLQAKYNVSIMTNQLRSQVPLPENFLHYQIPISLIGFMLNQNPNLRPPLDKVVGNWNYLASIWSVAAPDADHMLNQLAKMNNIIPSYQPEEEAFLKSKLGTYLTEDQVLQIGTLIEEYFLEEYVIIARSDGRFQIALITEESKKLNHLIVFDGTNKIGKPYKYIYTIDIDLMMLEAADQV